MKRSQIAWRIGETVGAVVLLVVVLIAALAILAMKLDFLTRAW